MRVRSVLQALHGMPLDAEIEFVIDHETGETFPELKAIRLEKETQIIDADEKGSPLSHDLVVESPQKCRMVFTV